MDQPIKTPTGKLMICPICRTPFRRTKQRPHVVTCSTECGDRWRAIRIREAFRRRKERRPGIIMCRCPLCQKEWEEKSRERPDQKILRIYCRACRRIVSRYDNTPELGVGVYES